jgi:hypothetical protein
MSSPDTAAETEAAPLSAEAKAIINRARRSFMVSIGLLLVGFIAIGGALVYRAARDDGGLATRYAVDKLRLPTGAEVMSSSVAEGLVTVTYRVGTAISLRVFDGKTGALAREIHVVTE